MVFFNKRQKTKNGKIVKTIKIQGSVEGGNNGVILESLLTGLKLNTTVPGTINAYKTYESQVAETYRKYNGMSDYGCQQTRTVIDLRMAFILGEGLSLASENENFINWLTDMLNFNKLDSSNIINAVKGGEITGQTLFLLKPILIDNEIKIKILRVPYTNKNKYRVIYDQYYDTIIDIQIKNSLGLWVSSNFDNYIYIRTGGDDVSSYGTVTKVGVVLTDLENYDRALKDMRRNNHIFARITPVFETTNEAEAKALSKKLNAIKWKIGTAFIGSAKFHYEVPEQGAHENLEKEMVTTIKTISSVTGIPVHWLGFVDLMSNRSTAQSLYEFIKQSTAIERKTWEDSFNDLIRKAQQLYIDSGGTKLNKVVDDFEVKLPLISFEGFLDLVKALNIAYSDEAISKADYMNLLPGINPIKTKQAIKEEDKEEEAKLVNMGINNKNLIGGNDGNNNG